MTTRPQPLSDASLRHGPARREAEGRILVRQGGSAPGACPAGAFASRVSRQAIDAHRIVASAALPATPAELTERERGIRCATLPTCARWTGIRIRPSSTSQETRP